MSLADAQVKLREMQALVAQHVKKCSEAGETNVDTPTLAVSVLVHLSAWSSSPVFDKQCLEIIQPAMSLISNGASIREKTKGKLLWSNIPVQLSDGYKAVARVVHPGADAMIPKLSFLCGDAASAKACWDACLSIKDSVEPCVKKLQSHVETSLSVSDAAVQAGVRGELNDKAFLDEFKTTDMDSKLKTIAVAITRAEVLRSKFGLDIEVKAAKETQELGRAAVNRAALLLLLGRGLITHPTKGRTLRSQLKSVWTSVQAHNLERLLPNGLAEQVVNTLGSADQGGEKDYSLSFSFSFSLSQSLNLSLSLSLLLSPSLSLSLIAFSPSLSLPP
jgi:hypothetical protein